MRHVSLDESIWLTAEQIEREQIMLEPRDFNADQRRQYAKQGVALPDGSYPIPDRDALRRAIQAFGRGGNKSSVKAHIIKRARALNATGALPDDWTSAAESPSLTSFIVMEGEVPKPTIVQEANANNGGVMRVKTPFYVGDSFANAPGFDRRIFWPREKLPEIVQEMKGKLQANTQPLTVYARHNHAISGDHLPIGRIVDVEDDGRIGWVTEEIAATSTGRDVQILLEKKMLNAASLRSGPGNFELSEKRVNQEDVYWPERFSVDGVDWAPDRPAMPTFGVQLLHEAPVIEQPKPTTSSNEGGNKRVDPITVDALRREQASIVAEIENPLRTQITTLSAERDELKKKVKELEDTQVRQERDWHLVQIAQKFSDPKKALQYLEQECRECKTKDEVAVKVLPIVLEAQKRKGQMGPAEKSPAQLLQEMLFPGTGNGQTLTQENGTTSSNGSQATAETAGGLPVPA